jgi:hypothetical protein
MLTLSLLAAVRGSVGTDGAIDVSAVGTVGVDGVGAAVAGVELCCEEAEYLGSNKIKHVSYFKAFQFSSKVRK